MISPVPESGSAPRRARSGIWRWTFALAVAGFLLYKALHGVDWTQVWHTVLEARWGYLAAAMLISTGSFTVRSAMAHPAERRDGYTVTPGHRVSGEYGRVPGQ